MGSRHISKNGMNLYLIKINQFCVKINDIWRLLTYGWVYGLMGGGHLKLRKIEINLDIINILILCEDLGSMETPKPMGGCMGWWVHGGQWVGS